MIEIGIIGDFDGRPSHLATGAALEESGRYLDMHVNVTWLPTELISRDMLSHFHGFFCAPGGPYKSTENALTAIRYAREKSIPFMGTCAGFQHAILEYARNVLKLKGELDNFIKPLACSLFEQQAEIQLNADSFCARVYKTTRIQEKFRCQNGLDPEFDAKLAGDLTITGRDEHGQAVVAELRTYPFFVISLFQPQLSSATGRPHPLINSFINAAYQHHSHVRRQPSPEQTPGTVSN